MLKRSLSVATHVADDQDDALLSDDWSCSVAEAECAYRATHVNENRSCCVAQADAAQRATMQSPVRIADIDSQATTVLPSPIDCDTNPITQDFPEPAPKRPRPATPDTDTCSEEDDDPTPTKSMLTDREDDVYAVLKKQLDTLVKIQRSLSTRKTLETADCFASILGNIDLMFDITATAVDRCYSKLAVKAIISTFRDLIKNMQAQERMVAAEF